MVSPRKWNILRYIRFSVGVIVINIAMSIDEAYTHYMVKTAISVPEDVFEAINRFAKEHKYSRSEVFVRASKEYLERIKSKEVLNALNAAHADEETEEEKTVRTKGKRYHRDAILKKELY